VAKGNGSLARPHEGIAVPIPARAWGACENNPVASIYEYVRHPRGAELHASKPFKTEDLRRTNHPNFFVRVNARVGLKVTLIVGTMWCAYAFTVLALFALPSAIKQGTYYVVVWLSSSFLQLVLLPIKDAEAVLKEAEEIQKHLLAQDQAITDIVTRLEKLTAPPTGA